MKAVILAGGLGTRLKPFTDIIPKPLLPLGEKSLMEVQLEQLKKNGFDEIYVALNYKADYIKSYFGDGSKFGVKVNYSLENKPLGTCGPVKLLENVLNEPFLLMNGDILTQANFKEIYEWSIKFAESFLTIVTKNIITPFHFGNIISDGVYVKGVEDKPDLKFEILSGIYFLKPSVFKLIPNDEYFGIDQLIKKMLEQNLPVTKYLLKEYWIDIGMVEDYEKAREFYDEHFTV
jgi:NDP-sugar pyrophosphorylase family protein